MAKKKKEKLYCDQTAETNMELIKTIGKVATTSDVYQAVSDNYARHALSKGAPITEIDDIVLSYMNKSSTMSEMVGLTAVNNWYWGGRQVYDFDKDIAKLLYSQTKEDIMIDSRALELLPCPHFYIQLNDDIRKGLFVSLSENTLYIADLGNTYTHCYGMKIPESNVLLSDIITDANKQIGNNVTKKEVSDLSSKAAVYMQFIVYLSAINADIEPLTKGCIIRQAGQGVRRSPKPDKTEIGNVGYRVGASLRAVRSVKDTIKYVGEHNQGSAKAPHIRRSHFHSFWTGSGDNKKLIIKWVNTIFVHGNDANIEVSTVHEVKKADEETNPLSEKK